MSGQKPQPEVKTGAVKRDVAVLFAFQIANYAVPLVTTPYLARILSPDGFGALGVATAITGYIILLSDWGFTLSASQAVAVRSSDPARVRRIFWDVLLAKVILASLGTIILAGLVLALSSVHKLALVLEVSELQVVASVLSVSWFLQGMERLSTMALATFFGRLTIIPLTFALVHTPQDVPMAAAVQGLSAMVAAALVLIFAFRAAPLLPVELSLRGALLQIGDGFRLFLSTASISLYTQMTIVVLGFTAGPRQAGLFNGADRIKRISQTATNPISAVMYPRINKMIAHNSEGVWASMMRMLYVQGAITFAISAAIVVLAPWITATFLGRQYHDAVNTVRMMGLTPFLIGVSNVLGINIMLPLGQKTAFTAIVLASGLLNLALLVPLSQHYGSLGAATSVVLSEVAVVVLMALAVFRMRGSDWISDRAKELART